MSNLQNSVVEGALIIVLVCVGLMIYQSYLFQ